MASSYYKPCKELDRCLELDKYWEKDMIASEEELKTYKKFCDCELGYAGGTQK